MAGLRVWAGQLGILATSGAIAVAAPGPLGHLPPFATWALNPLSPKSDLHQITPDSINM